MKTTNYICKIIFIAVMITLNTVAMSQPLPPEGNAGSLGPMGGAAPLDGGLLSLWILIPAYILKNKIHTLARQLFRKKYL